MSGFSGAPVLDSSGKVAGVIYGSYEDGAASVQRVEPILAYLRKPIADLQEPQKHKGSHAKYLKRHPTTLLERGPAPFSDGKWDLSGLPGAEVAQYRSPAGKLKGIFWPSAKATKNSPALVYLSMSNTVDPSQLEFLQSFHEAGYTIFAPALRGQAGNPGNSELVRGEVDDATAAIKWLVQNKKVDKNQVFVFGVGVGGGVSALLSLDKTRIALGGSFLGLFNRESLRAMESLVRFDLSKEEELDTRTLIGHLNEMRSPHIGYMPFLAGAQWFRMQNRYEGGPKSKLSVVPMEGKGFESLEPSIDRFFQVVQAYRRKHGFLK